MAQYNYPYNMEPLFAYVNGIEGARNYPLAFGRSAVLMDTQAALFYFKESNSMGQATLKAYEFKEVALPAQQQAQYATKAEIEDIAKKLDELIRQKGEAQ